MKSVVKQSLAAFLTCTVLSWATTAVESSKGVPLTQTAEELADWDKFYQQFPEKESFTREEFDERQKVIDAIHDKHIEKKRSQLNPGTFLTKADSRLFKREAIKGVLYWNCMIWFVVTVLFRVSLIGSAFIAVLICTFAYLRLFLVIESVFFLVALFAGSAVYLVSTKVRSLRDSGAT